MGADLDFIIGEGLAKYIKQQLIQYLAIETGKVLAKHYYDISVKVHSMKQVNFKYYSNTINQAMIGVVCMKPLNDSIFFGLDEDLFKLFLHYPFKDYLKSVSNESLMLKVLKNLRDSFSPIKIRPRLSSIETCPHIINNSYLGLRNTSGTFVEILVRYEDFLAGKMNFFYPERTMEKIKEIAEKADVFWQTEATTHLPEDLSFEELLHFDGMD